MGQVDRRYRDKCALLGITGTYLESHSAAAWGKALGPIGRPY